MYNYAIIMQGYTKKKRQQIIKKLITDHDIGGQLQLLEELHKQKISATQATISRDLQEMGVVKVSVKPGVHKYQLMGKVPKGVLWEKLKIFFGNFVSEIKSTNNLILIKTSPGNANGVAILIDRVELRDILGTIAGDDTVLVIVDTVKNSKIIEKEFSLLLEK